MSVEIGFYLVLKCLVLDKLTDGVGAFGVVEGDDDAVLTVAYLTAGGGVVGDDDGLAEHLGLTHGDGLTFKPRGLYVDVAGFDVGVGVALLAQDDDIILHASLGNLPPDVCLVTAKADEVPLCFNGNVIQLRIEN